MEHHLTNNRKSFCELFARRISMIMSSYSIVYVRSGYSLMDVNVGVNISTFYKIKNIFVYV
jgi:hypothetical protein